MNVHTRDYCKYSILIRSGWEIQGKKSHFQVFSRVENLGKFSEFGGAIASEWIQSSSPFLFACWLKCWLRRMSVAKLSYSSLLFNVRKSRQKNEFGKKTFGNFRTIYFLYVYHKIMVVLLYLRTKKRKFCRTILILFFYSMKLFCKKLSGYSSRNNYILMVLKYDLSLRYKYEIYMIKI